MHLSLNGRKYPIAQMGGGMLIFEEPFSAAAGEGEVVLTVDGVPRRWWVKIHDQGVPSRTITSEFRDAE